MKKIKYGLYTLLVFFIGCTIVNAAPSATLSVSSSSVENGKKVTASVTVKNTAAWNIKIISSGNTNGCSQSFADATSSGNNATKTFSVTCKATSIGAIGFTLSGDITSSDGTNVKVSGSKRVSVVEPRPLSENNYLKSITVGDYSLNPSFNEEVSDYSVSVPSTINQITIGASVKDNYASVSGTGTFDVNEGANSFTLTVTAENGSTRNYNVVVNVEDLNPINIKVNDNEYVIIKNAKNVQTPELFTLSSTTINDIEVPAYVNEINDFILVPVKDTNGKIFFVIKNEDGTYKLYRNVNINNTILYLIEKDEKFQFEKTNLTLGDFDTSAYQINDDYYLVYGINMSNGNESWYKYDKKENTIQRYENKKELELNNTIKEYTYVIMLFAGTLLLAIIGLIASIIISNKRVKKTILKMQIKNIEEAKNKEIEQEEKQEKRDNNKGSKKKK